MQNNASQFLGIGPKWRLRSWSDGQHAVVMLPARFWPMDSEVGDCVVVQTIVACVQRQCVNGCVGGVCRLSTGCGHTASTWRSTSISSTSLPSWGRRSAPSSPASTASPPWSPSTWGRNSRRTTWVARPTFAPHCGGFPLPTTSVLQAIGTSELVFHAKNNHEEWPLLAPHCGCSSQPLQSCKQSEDQN